ncbi:MAG: hypothetical protein KME12_19395 [Trichocoleus desertorum ATA4-8-CV12]|jgi:Uma2 family endonuclease|nr:hypothetical protein [Trichocoleus desertorum ATA4-8-CV12]
MTQAVVRPRVSFEEYIDICAQTEERYELVRGDDPIQSPAFKCLNLTANQVCSTERSQS